MFVVHNVTVSKHTYDIIKYIDMIEICDFLVVCRVVKQRISHTKVSFLILKDTINLRRKKTIIGTEMLVYFSSVHLISVSMNVPIFRSYLLIAYGRAGYADHQPYDGDAPEGHNYVMVQFVRYKDSAFARGSEKA